MDNAEPSTNGTSSRNLHRLSSILDDADYATYARRTVLAFEAEIMQHPFLFASMMDAVVIERLGTKGVVITGEGDEVEGAVRRCREVVAPATTVVRLGGSAAKSEWLRERNGLLASMDETKQGVQVCERGACREVLGVGDIGRVLER
jgi:uncharacterized protein YyaL (SSP411 family)